MNQNNSPNNVGANTAKKRLLLTVPGGGFYWESMQLREQLAGHFELQYVAPHDFYAPDDMPFDEQDLHRVNTVTTLSRAKTMQKLTGFIKAFIASRRVIKATKPDLLVCVGSSISLPLAFWAKLYRIPTQFVESITRVDHLSSTGRLIQKFKLAEKIYVQWPHMVTSNPGTTYQGTVL